MNIKKFIKDVRGAALVYVIVAAAVIVLLGAATTATAYVSLRSTQVQEQSDNNFYSADAVMNAIVSGLESDISRAYETAYTHVITNINNYDSVETVQGEFNSIFLNTLNAALSDGAESFSSFYSTSHIQGYVQNVYANDIRYTVTAMHGENYLDATEDGMILRNLHVTYEDDSGYYDEITTDIKIAIPTFNPEFIPNDQLQTKLNALVIDDGLEIAFRTGLQINGDAYINERESDHSAILLQDGTSLSIISPEEVIAGGQIVTKENTKLVFKGASSALDGNKIWTENFDLGRYSDADISGQIFVYDDMEINGSYSEVRLAGEYYGYNESGESYNDPDKSSAINVNGAHVTLDIEKLDMLVLAGSSYIATSDVDPENEKYGTNYNNSTNIQTGEALSVKSNQIAYLVDDKEFNDADVKDFVSNPMSYAQYEKMCTSNGNWATASRNMLKKELSYGKSYEEFGASIVPVFSGKDNGTVYLYLNFADPDKAAEYFVTAYRGNSLLSQRLRTYAAQYLTRLQLNTNTYLLVNENYIDQSVALYTEESIPLDKDGLGYDQSDKTAEQQAALDSALLNIRTEYLGDENVEQDGKKYEVLYSELINEEQLEAFIDNAVMSNTFTDHHTNDTLTPINDIGVILSGTNGAKAIIVNNKNKDPYELGSGKGLVIVSGDIKITGDWLGTIIVGGRAYCTEGTKETPLDITVSESIVHSVLPLYFTTKNGDTVNSMMVMNIFTGYENIKVNTATNNEGINADMISNCITFTNWNRY